MGGPGGGVEPGELPLAALCRELHEETGLVIDADVLKDNAPVTEAGYPDLTILGDGRVLFRELKDANGSLSQAQKRTRKLLARAGADYEIWRPDDLASGRIEQQLAGIAMPEDPDIVTVGKPFVFPDYPAYVYQT